MNNLLWLIIYESWIIYVDILTSFQSSHHNKQVCKDDNQHHCSLFEFHSFPTHSHQSRDLIWSRITTEVTDSWYKTFLSIHQQDCVLVTRWFKNRCWKIKLVRLRCIFIRVRLTDFRPTFRLECSWGWQGGGRPTNLSVEPWPWSRKISSFRMSSTPSNVISVFPDGSKSFCDLKNWIYILIHLAIRDKSLWSTHDWNYAKASPASGRFCEDTTNRCFIRNGSKLEVYLLFKS